MPIVRVQLAVLELLVVFFYVTCTCFLEQVVSGIHLDTEALQCLNDLVHVGDNGFFGVFIALYLCQEMINDRIVHTEFHLLGVHHDQFQFSGMFLIEQAGNDCIQSHRFSLSCGTGDEQMWHLGQVHHEHLVCDGLP